MLKYASFRAIFLGLVLVLGLGLGLETGRTLRLTNCVIISHKVLVHTYIGYVDMMGIIIFG